MPYVQIEDFRLGLDLRKSALTAPNGSLRELTNAHITPGGEIEKRLAFVDSGYDLTDTYGLADLADEIWVFGSTAQPGTFPGTGDGGVLSLNYQQLVGSSGGTFGEVNEIHDWEIFEGKLYVVATFNVFTGPAEERYQHFYDGAYVTGGKGETVRTFKSRIYSVLGTVLYYCSLNDPTDWGTDAGGTGDGGFIDISTQDANVKELVGLEIYYDQLALFSKFSVVLMLVDVDPLKTQHNQIIRNVGAVTHAAITGYGNGDVMFLSQSGIRSLKAKDINSNASVSDIGSPLDSIIREELINDDTGYQPLYSVLPFLSEVNPVSGRLWMTSESHAHILSFYANTKITAWSVYEMGFEAQHIIVSNSRVCLRNKIGDQKLYLYGGYDRDTYDNSKVTAILPFADANDPATFKTLRGIDATVEGAWKASIAMSPEDPNMFEDLASISAPTLAKRSLAAQGYSTHFALKFTHEAAEHAVISNAIIHYDDADKH